LQAVQQDAQVLFSVLAQHGHADETSARRAYEAACIACFRAPAAYGSRTLAAGARPGAQPARPARADSAKSSWSKRWSRR
jgi:hypothetical protein